MTPDYRPMPVFSAYSYMTSLDQVILLERDYLRFQNTALNALLGMLDQLQWQNNGFAEDDGRAPPWDASCAYL